MIPNILHFVFGMAPDFGGKPFSLVHYLAIKSAVELNTPAAAYFHYEYEPEGEWWDKAKKLVHLNPLKAPRSILGNTLHHVAHQADVVRLEQLKEMGGIYLDLDTISTRAYTELLVHSFVIGQELRSPYIPKNFRQKIKYAVRQRLGLAGKKSRHASGLCNAVLFSEKNSAFVTRWLNSYKTFRSKGRDKYWNEHSVKIPEKLAARHPEELTILGPYAFHYPLYDEAGLRAMFEEEHSYPDAYLHHLWESFSWAPYLSRINISDIRTRNTSYNCIARRFI